MKKIFRIMLGMAAALMATSCSDTSELPDAPVNPGEGGDGVYMSVTVQMPTASGGSRSETTNNGQSTDKTEDGKDYENKVSSIAVVLAKPDDNGFITWGHVDNPSASADNKLYNATAKISKTALGIYYKANTKASKEVNVFVFCNPTGELETKLKQAAYGDHWEDEICTATSETSSIWNKNSFLMNNQMVTSRELPKNLSDWKNYASEANPFKLSGSNNEANVDNSSNGRGPIKVERSVARFDFKDGSPTNDRKYNVVFAKKDNGEIDESEPFFAVELQRMALVNMAKEFYYLHRVSDDGTSTGWEICGNEHNVIPDKFTKANYVVGPKWDTFNIFSFGEVNGTNTFQFGNYFHYPYFNDDGSIDNTNTSDGDQWGTAIIEDILKKENDNYVSDDKVYDKSFHIWRYVTEHTLPAEQKQVNGISTGVVFKGKIIPTDKALSADEKKYPGIKKLAEAINAGLKGNSKEDPILYSFNGNLYLSFSSLYDAAIEAAVTFNEDETQVVSVNRTMSIYKAVFGNGGLGEAFKYPYESTSDITFNDPENKSLSQDCAFIKWKTWYDKRNTNEYDALIDEMRKAVTGAGITIYQSSNDAKYGTGYYCYYTYWNRHNDNGLPATMGPMEFGVVRNNVYKLSVTKISRLGHPRISANDPDPDKPDKPDESDNVYISVSCEVIPWVVRINEIEF